MSLRLRRFAMVGVGVVVAGLMLWLGLWQMQTARMNGHQAVVARASASPVPVNQVAPGNDFTAAWGQQVTLVGSYLPQYQLYVGSGDALRVVTAFRTTDGRIVAVVRGTTRRGVVPAPPPKGQLSQSGVALPADKPADPPTPSGTTTPTMDSIRLPVLAQSWPSPLVNGYVTLNAESARSGGGLPAAEVELPQGDEASRNAGYALQWWVFAAFAIVGSVIIARSFKDAPVPRPRDPSESAPGHDG